MVYPSLTVEQSLTIDLQRMPHHADAMTEERALQELQKKRPEEAKIAVFEAAKIVVKEFFIANL